MPEPAPTLQRELRFQVDLKLEVAPQLEAFANLPTKETGISHQPSKLQGLIKARLAGEQDINFASTLRQSIRSKDPAKIQVITLCLLYECDRWRETQNKPYKRFSDIIANTIINVSDDNCSKQLAHFEDFQTKLQKRLLDMSFNDLKTWLMRDKEDQAKLPFNDLYQHLVSRAYPYLGMPAQAMHARRFLEEATCILFSKTKLRGPEISALLTNLREIDSRSTQYMVGMLMRDEVPESKERRETLVDSLSRALNKHIRLDQRGIYHAEGIAHMHYKLAELLISRACS